jgi:nitroreductase
MNVNFPDAATVRAALMLANRAPSVHNTQPWRWRVGEHSLHLYANRDLKLVHTDPDQRDLILSCGAALNHCVVAFAALGWQSKIRRLPNPADPDHLASIQLHRHPASEADVSLAAAVPRRRTDRRTYSSWPVPQRDIGLMGARAARAGVMLRRVEELDKLKSAVAEAAWQHRTDAEYLTELTAWSGRYASTAGVPARSTPSPDSMASIPARTFAGPVLAQPKDVDPTDDNAVVIALGTADDDEISRLRAGEATSLVLLTATALGLASCPITEPLEIPETREEIRADVFGADAYPQMLIRIGWASINAEPLPSTPRRDLSETVAGLE